MQIVERTFWRGHLNILKWSTMTIIGNYHLQHGREDDAILHG